MYHPLLSLFKRSLYVDLGTANTLVIESNKGLIANEPSVVAIANSNAYDSRVVAVGSEAKRQIGKTPGSLTVTRPLKEGVIANSSATEALLNSVIESKDRNFFPKKLELVVSLPYSVTAIERQAVRDCAYAAGARQVSLIDEPMAAALGMNLPVHSAIGNMVIDLGGGTTEVAIISLYGVVLCEAVRVGGYAFDAAIIDFVKRKHNLVIGEQTAERAKIEIGTARPDLFHDSTQIRGLDFTSGLPRETEITSSEINRAIEPLLQEIIETAKKALRVAPPELLTDIVRNGAFLAGGGALLRGLVSRLELELGIPIHTADNPLLALAEGGRRILQNRALLESIALA